MKKVLFLGRFPPPVHGAAKMNELYSESTIIKRHFKVKKIKINSDSTLSGLGSFSMKKISWYIKTLKSLISNLETFDPDVIYFEISPSGLSFYRDSLYALIIKSLSKPIIFHIHSKKVINNFFSRFIYKKEKIILLSKNLKAYLKNQVKSKDIYYLENGISNKVSQKEFMTMLEKRKEEGKIHIVYLSNMIPSKGIYDLLHICNFLKKEGKEFTCTLSGNWQNKKEEKSWKMKREELGLEQTCSFIGPSYGKKKKKLLSSAHILLFPTSYERECYPLVILEAFMYGLPVFSYNNGAIKDIIEENYQGKIVEKGDWKSLAKTIKSYSFSAKISKKIRQQFLKKHQLKMAEEKLLRILENETK